MSDRTAMIGTAVTQGGDGPVARFGHTTTFVGQGKVILFGGAIGDSGRYQITNDSYILDLAQQVKWKKLETENSPTARAAHAAAAVNLMQFCVFGGATGGGSLSSEELHLLDLRKPSLAWLSVPVAGLTPGRRYGHSMVYHKPNLIVFGGNDGVKCVSDVWYMDVEKPPFRWLQVTLQTELAPSARVYHTAEICREGPAHGMMVVFGGRTTEQTSLLDAWGLRQHRDGRWDWVQAPTKRGDGPSARFQHTAVFLGSKMVVIGGRDSDVARSLPTAVYDTEACEWRQLPAMRRFRHSSWALDGTMVYILGGFDHRTQSHPTSDLFSIDVSTYKEFYSEREHQKRAGRRAGTGGFVAGSGDESGAVQARPPVGSETAAGRSSVVRQSIGSQGSQVGRSKEAGQGARLAPHVYTRYDDYNDFSALVSKISIADLQEEGRKIQNPGTGGARLMSHPYQQSHEDEAMITLADKFIKQLLRPNITPATLLREFAEGKPFSLEWRDVKDLCLYAMEILKDEEMVLSLRAPIKVYGDIHGQFSDLMRLFRSYKSPIDDDFRERADLPNDFATDGDIDSTDYLFLGDYVDRGTNSLEVICLLLALKCKFPHQVHMIRGNHEDPAINSIYGFKEECKSRLREDPDSPGSCWERFNQVFEWLPVGALIGKRILCIHGGIGGSIHTIEHISSLPRPLKVSQIPQTELDQRVTDLLWSDPTDNDTIRGVMQNNTRDPDGSGHIVKFGPDRVTQFVKENQLDMIIRAHECVMDGFERFAGGLLITLFSATDYCQSHRNAGAVLYIRRDMMIVPKTIYPVGKSDLREYRPSSWINDFTRPPTPPRSAPKGNINPW
eukprot:GHVN01095953.1.p1 GENE.GHVN01095953.1~~GHVN01095953.1.p1  ORF type:complete len:840 (+),score=106.76 GHVN01095953.1:827-3346(+)